MSFALPKLNYQQDALEPYISAETFSYHYGKHHATYVNKLNEFIENNPDFQDASLIDIIRESTSRSGVFNNAAQHYNHSFYWACLSPNLNQSPEGTLLSAITEAFGSYDTFKEEFTQAALTQFGSGWAWLSVDENNKLVISATGNADNPLLNDHQPLLTCDVWEHAYYIDTRNSRPAYLENFWKLVNWDFVNEQFHTPNLKFLDC